MAHHMLAFCFATSLASKAEEATTWHRGRSPAAGPKTQKGAEPLLSSPAPCHPAAHLAGARAAPSGSLETIHSGRVHRCTAATVPTRSRYTDMARPRNEEHSSRGVCASRRGVVSHSQGNQGAAADIRNLMSFGVDTHNSQKRMWLGHLTETRGQRLKDLLIWFGARRSLWSVPNTAVGSCMRTSWQMMRGGKLAFRNTCATRCCMDGGWADNLGVRQQVRGLPPLAARIQIANTCPLMPWAGAETTIIIQMQLTCATFTYGSCL